MKHRGPQQPRHAVIKHANGLTACDQGTAYGFPISYNPDDDRFYVHDTGKDAPVLAIRRLKQNAVQAARLFREERGKKGA